MSFVKFYLIFDSFFFLVESLIFVFHACDLHNLRKNTHTKSHTNTHKHSHDLHLWLAIPAGSAAERDGYWAQERDGAKTPKREDKQGCLRSAHMRYILWMQIPVHSDLVYLLAGGFRFPFTLHPYFLFHSCLPFPLPYMPHTHTHTYKCCIFMYTCGRITFFIRRSLVFYSFISHFHSCEFGAKNLRNEAKGFLQKYPAQGLTHYFLFNLIFLTSSVNINLPMYIFSLKDWWKYQFSICQKFEHFALIEPKYLNCLATPAHTLSCPIFEVE